MPVIELDECENCGRKIGKLETPHVWNNNTVCEECHGLLRKSASTAGGPASVSAPLSADGEQQIANGVAKGILKVICIVLVGAVGLVVVFVLLPRFKTSPRGLSVTAITSEGKVVRTLEPKLTFADEQLFAALDAHDMDMVKSAMQGEPNLNAVGKEGLTPLARVLELDDIYNDQNESTEWRKLAEVFIHRGADVNLGGSTQSSIYQAKSEWAVNLLVSHGAKIEGDASNGSPLYWGAGAYKGAPICTILLSHGANVNAKMFDGETPLHHAAAENATDVIQLLLDHGADINAKDDKGYTPLKRAKLSMQDAAATLLIQRGGKE